MKRKLKSTREEEWLKRGAREAAEQLFDYQDVNQSELMTDATLDAIYDAAERFGIHHDIDKDDRAEWVDFYTRVLMATGEIYSLRPRSASEEIARHISAILNNPETPFIMQEAIRSAMLEMFNAGNSNKLEARTEYIKSLIEHVNAMDDAAPVN